MNTTFRSRQNRLNRKNLVNPLIDNQTATTETDETSEEETPTEVEQSEFGPMLTSTFSIKVKTEDDKGVEKIAYENKKEPFKYQTVTNFPSLLRYLGAKDFPDANIDFLGQALTSKDEEVNKSIGEAVADLLKIANAKFKSDAKSSAYQGLVNKYAPLEGEKKMTAIARTINNFVKLAGITPEVAIEVLRSKGAIDADYTVQDYKDTKLRKAKDSAEEDLD